MEPDYWQKRWAEGRTGWHQPEVNALLRQHWSSLAVPAGSRVFVPLCGKSADMAWLAAQGHAELGVELSTAACAAFFARSDEHTSELQSLMRISYAVLFLTQT